MSVAVDKAYAALREKIFSGELVAGDRLKERELCEELEVSRTPVREALRRLQADGLVLIEPRRGGIVAGVSVDEVNEIYSLGILLESYAARLAADCVTPEALAALDEILEQMAIALRDDSPESRQVYLELDSDLHRHIIEITGNRRLGSLLSQIVGIPVLVQAFNRYSHQELKKSLEQHRNIVAALHAADPEWAEAAMRSHIHSARAIMVPETAPSKE